MTNIIKRLSELARNQQRHFDRWDSDLGNPPSHIIRSKKTAVIARDEINRLNDLLQIAANLLEEADRVIVFEPALRRDFQDDVENFLRRTNTSEKRCATCANFEQSTDEPLEYGLCGHRGDDDPGSMHKNDGADCDSYQTSQTGTETE